MSSASALKSHTALQVFLLGNVKVELEGTRLRGLETPRLQRLLAYISINEGHSRAQLAYELWPDSTEGQALGNLRKLLHDLRAELPDADRFLEITQQHLRWRPAAPVTVDALEFRRAVAQGDLAGAAGLYGGDLLPGSYDDRIAEERDRLRTEAVTALTQLATSALSASDDEAAARYARGVLAIDKLSESAYRILMRACARRGDRAEAFRAYHRCVAVLQKELGVEPDDQTRAVYEALGTATSAETPALPLPTARFVGRATEFQDAVNAWRQAARGKPQLLLVTGEPGIGKTRLVEELANAALGGGAGAASARAYQAAGRPPWGPVIEWLRSAAVRPNINRLEPVWVAELARLLPELGNPPGDAMENDAGRSRLLDALSRALSAGSRPLLLVLDDLQWCDRETIQMIGHLLASSADLPLMVAATLRSDESDDAHMVSVLRASLDRDKRLTEIRLGRLDAVASRDLAASVLGRPMDPADADRLWRDTEGQPLFIVEAARTGIDPGSRANLSRTVRSVISSRLAQLSPAAQRLVELAATVGRSFSVEVLAEAGGSDEDSLVEVLDEAWRRQIIREQGTGYDFSHDRIREVAYDLIAPARRRSLHRAVAAALESRTPVVEWSVVAAHYHAAGMAENALDAYQQAGRRSVEVFALDDAISAFRNALLLLEGLPPGRRREETELEIRMALGVPLVAREGYGSDAVQDCYVRATALCERLGRQVESPVLRGLGLAALMSCRFDRSERYGRSLLDQAAEDQAAAVEGNYLLGVGSFWRGDLEAAGRHLGTAIDQFNPAQAQSHAARYAQDPRAVCLVRLAVNELWSGRPDSSRTLAEEAVRYATTLNHPTTEGYVRMYTAMLGVEWDEPAFLAAEVAAGEAIWSERRLGYFLRVGSLMKGWLAVISGHGHDTVDRALQGWRHEAQTLHLTYGMTLLARALLREGRLTEGTATVNEALRWSLEHDQLYLLSELKRLQGELAILGGDREAGIRLLQVALEEATRRGAGWFELKAACSLARHGEPGADELMRTALSAIEGGWEPALVREAKDLKTGTLSKTFGE